DFFRQVSSKYGTSPYAADAYYWRAFALYKTEETANYSAALAALDEQKKRFPNASTRDDGEELATRIRGIQARSGDSEAAAEIARRAKAKDSGSKEPIDMKARLAAINALMQMNSEQAVPILKRILAKRDEASAPLRERALFILSQKPGDDTVDLLVDVSRNDPSSDVREKAVSWLSQVPGERS